MNGPKRKVTKDKTAEKREKKDSEKIRERR